MRLRAPPTGPPTVLDEEPVSTSTPAPVFPIARVPVVSVPIMFPWTRLPVASLISIPFLLAAMRFAACGTVPPIVLPEAVPTRTPMLLPSAIVPVKSVPIKFPATRFPDAVAPEC